MKKLLVTVIIVGGLVGAYYWLSTKARLSITALEGVSVEVTRGDLEIPIGASGHIKPASITSIKSKAAGEVVKIPFKPGQVVKRGDLLVELLDVDERRSVERATSERDAARIALERTRIEREVRELVGVPLAEAKVRQLTAQRDRAQVAKESKEQIRGRDESLVPLVEITEVRTAYAEASALLEMAEAELNNARYAVKLSMEDVKASEERLKAAEAALGDAQERLSETKVHSPIDGMVIASNVQVGEVVTGGMNVLGTGTVLMEVADVSEIYAVVNVDEADIAQVHDLAPKWARPGGEASPEVMGNGILEEGVPVRVTVESFWDEDFHGHIERIAPQAEERAAIATFKVWIPITSSNRDKLIPLLNTQAEAHFTAQSVQDAVLVNYDAIHLNPNGEGVGVYVPPKEGEEPEPQFRLCEPGLDNGIEVEILNGCVEPGDKVYTRLPQRTRRERESSN